MAGWLCPLPRCHAAGLRQGLESAAWERALLGFIGALNTEPVCRWAEAGLAPQAEVCI